MPPKRNTSNQRANLQSRQQTSSRVQFEDLAHRYVPSPRPVSNQGASQLQQSQQLQKNQRQAQQASNLHLNQRNQHPPQQQVIHPNSNMQQVSAAQKAREAFFKSQIQSITTHIEGVATFQEQTGGLQRPEVLRQITQNLPASYHEELIDLDDFAFISSIDQIQDFGIPETVANKVMGSHKNEVNSKKTVKSNKFQYLSSDDSESDESDEEDEDDDDSFFADDDASFLRHVRRQHLQTKQPKNDKQFVSQFQVERPASAMPKLEMPNKQGRSQHRYSQEEDEQLIQAWNRCKRKGRDRISSAAIRKIFPKADKAGVKIVRDHIRYLFKIGVLQQPEKYRH